MLQNNALDKISNAGAFYSWDGHDYFKHNEVYMGKKSSKRNHPGFNIELLPEHRIVFVKKGQKYGVFVADLKFNDICVPYEHNDFKIYWVYFRPINSIAAQSNAINKVSAYFKSKKDLLVVYPIAISLIDLQKEINQL